VSSRNGVAVPANGRRAAESMLKLRFFASIREKLGQGSLDVRAAPDVVDVASLVRHLDAGPMPGCAATLLADNSLVAINRQLASPSTSVEDGDEIAFYPPVTGG